MIWNIKGYNVLVDDEDYEKFRKYSYHIQYNSALEGRYYFIRVIRISGIYKESRALHRDVMGCTKGDGVVIDHIDGNTLNCCKSNLRKCSTAENSQNRRINHNNTSNVKGVYLHEGKWRVRIQANKIRYFIGDFYTLEEAKVAYEDASKKYHGKFGRCV